MFTNLTLESRKVDVLSIPGSPMRLESKVYTIHLKKNNNKSNFRIYTDITLHLLTLKIPHDGSSRKRDERYYLTHPRTWTEGSDFGEGEHA